MQNFVIGQRCINTLELQLGLGTVQRIDHRSVEILFKANGEIRTYAKQSAPLIRVLFSVGDAIRCQDGTELIVQSLFERQELITYRGIDPEGRYRELPESELDNFVRLDRPADRLFSGQIDSDKWFELRYRTVLLQNRIFGSELRGLTGCRTSLIPHQLYIAHEVATRFAPRVLLADEVGLGKTIEAGLILHRQLITDHAERALIVVPENLVHQWLVEMLRRFNLFFSLFDESRCVAASEGSGHVNPFFSEQLVLVSLDYLVRNPRRGSQAAKGEWDLVIVDEAHHLQWSPDDSSPEYRLVEQLAAGSGGLLLLTGTPEQLGKSSHFASLRLLDPDRFPDLQAFIDEEKDYAEVAAAIHALMDERALSGHELKILRNLLARDEDLDHLGLLDTAVSGLPEVENARREIIGHLLDRHGTGRVLFRNTRAAIRGFPHRSVFPHPLPLPEAYRDLAAILTAMDERSYLYPEVCYRDNSSVESRNWTEIDPRVDWLQELIRTIKPGKVLVITVSARTAIDLAEHLKLRSGIAAAVFHEDMRIVERDRAAAFFANTDSGSPVMICSEIGSEGRNFQFSHDLVLFDLPLNPDLLEQRIGRLDRIGQTHTVNIHVPYLEGSAQAILYRWYHDGLDAFANTCPTGHSVFVEVREKLIRILRNASNEADELIALTRDLNASQRKKLHLGRDRLLEYNSCRPDAARRFVEMARAWDREPVLPEFMEQVFDCFGVDSEIRGTHVLVLQAANHLATPFPGLPDDGLTVTFDRETALAQEDVQYLTWDHPIVTRVMEQIGGSELGNSAFTVLKTKLVAPGTLILECLFILEAGDAPNLRGVQCLPPTAIRIVIDRSGTDYESTLPHEIIRENQRTVALETAVKFINARQSEIRELIRVGEEKARTRAVDIIEIAKIDAGRKLNEEINRLKALKKTNPNVRKEEIDYFRDRLMATEASIDSASVRLHALRVIFSI